MRRNRCGWKEMYGHLGSGEGQHPKTGALGKPGGRWASSELPKEKRQPCFWCVVVQVGSVWLWDPVSPLFRSWGND